MNTIESAFSNTQQPTTPKTQRGMVVQTGLKAGQAVNGTYDGSPIGLAGWGINNTGNGDGIA